MADNSNDLSAHGQKDYAYWPLLVSVDGMMAHIRYMVYGIYRIQPHGTPNSEFFRDCHFRSWAALHLVQLWTQEINKLQRFEK